MSCYNYHQIKTRDFNTLLNYAQNIQFLHEYSTTFSLKKMQIKITDIYSHPLEKTGCVRWTISNVSHYVQQKISGVN